MTSVRVSVDAGPLGDVEVTLDDGVGYGDGPVAARAVVQMLDEATARVRAAYGATP